jgi:hypothetical protein
VDMDSLRPWPALNRIMTVAKPRLRPGAMPIAQPFRAYAATDSRP